MTTFLQMVNEVLVRLREEQVYTVNQNAYSTMIGLYVNDSKKQVEEAWEWDALNTTVPLSTIPGTTTYTLTGSGMRQKGINANITTSGRQSRVLQRPMRWIQDQQQLSIVTPGAPCYFAWNGNDGTDSKVEIFPTPDAVYSMAFNMNVPQVDLSDDADIVSVPYEPIVAGAFARALVERGEDGALSSSEAYSLFKGVLADRIAIEQTRYEDFDVWAAV